MEGGIDLLAYANAAPEAARSIGHTSVVLKLKLRDGLDAAWKPASTRGPARYKGEIAAYRLATALGLSNVPPAILRKVDRRTLTQLLRDPALLGELPAGDVVPGALIPWIKGLRFLPLESSQPEWQRWLSAGGRVPTEKMSLARQISTMIAFDYVTANWDRWSGGNVGWGLPAPRADGDELLFIDNDAAFFEAPPAVQMAAMQKRLATVARFSRTFVKQLRGLTLEGVRVALGEEEPGRPLLPSTIQAGVMARTTDLLRVIDASIARNGDREGLFFE